MDDCIVFLNAHDDFKNWFKSLGIGTIIASLVAGTVAWASARRTVKTEIHKVQLGAQQRMHELLVAARLNDYGELSGFITHLWKEPPDVGYEIPVLEVLLKKLDAWDIAHGMLLGPETTNDFHNFRWLIYDVLADLRASQVDKTSYGTVRKSVHRYGMQLELSLRSDIGVYGVGITKSEKFLAMYKRNSWDDPSSLE